LKGNKFAKLATKKEDNQKDFTRRVRVRKSAKEDQRVGKGEREGERRMWRRCSRECSKRVGRIL
jgi:hypothetical protein